jgi:hypothetical protein
MTLIKKYVRPVNDMDYLCVYYNPNFIYHSKNGLPSFIDKHPEYNIYSWYKNGIKYRDDDKYVFLNTQVEFIIWYVKYVSNYRYHGYAKISISGKYYLFIHGICLSILRDQLI